MMVNKITAENYCKKQPVQKLHWFKPKVHGKSEDQTEFSPDSQLKAIRKNTKAQWNECAS
ncbi:MAG TPA: hypothetical protein DDX71_00875 [Ruminococcus sp.]|nr:hypothetical protein [Ruminococcus sp.]